MRPGDDTAAALRARLNEELGFYPASLDPESIAEYRRKAAEGQERCRQLNPGISAVEEIQRWLAVIGVRRG